METACADGLCPLCLQRRVREAEAENKRISELHKGLMAEADSRLEAAERRLEREGLPWCEVHGPYRGSGCPQCFSAARKESDDKG